MPEPTTIGKLRWPVTIAYRGQAPSVEDGGITETLSNQVTAWADIQPTGALTYYSGVQVDTPITHRVTLRWMDWLDTTHVILRDMRRPDGTVRRETFRIRRVKEVEGRQRFVECECELEKRE